MNENVIFFVAVTICLAIIGIHGARRAAQEHFCTRCGGPFQETQLPVYLNLPEVMMSTSAMRSSSEGIGRPCTACGRTYCSASEEPGMLCGSDHQHLSPVRLSYHGGNAT
jgi:hypothetical protein